MQRGKLIVFEGIYGSGRLIVKLVNRLREALVAHGLQVTEIDSPDGGRAQLMGAGELDGFWRYGQFMSDFFFELASRARVCAVTRTEQAAGRWVLCKGFTLSSLVYAQLKGHDWFREDLNVLEARARVVAGAGEVAADHTIFIDLAPARAVAELGSKLAGVFTPEDVARQRQLYLEEIARLPAGQVTVIDGNGAEDAVLEQVLAAVRPPKP
jgi:dTMP kinase